MLKSKALSSPLEQPFVIDCEVVDEWTVTVEFDTHLLFTFIPRLNEHRAVIGIEEFKLTQENELTNENMLYAHYVSTAPDKFKVITISKRLLAELFDIAWLDYASWQLADAQQPTRELLYKYRVVETTHVIAEELHHEVQAKA
jgi:hypothetical protein